MWHDQPKKQDIKNSSGGEGWRREGEGWRRQKKEVGQSLKKVR